MTPDEIHELGKRQVAAIENQMEILRRLGRSEGTVKARIEKLQADLGSKNLKQPLLSIQAATAIISSPADPVVRKCPSVRLTNCREK